MRAGLRAGLGVAALAAAGLIARELYRAGRVDRLGAVLAGIVIWSVGAWAIAGIAHTVPRHIIKRPTLRVALLLFFLAATLAVAYLQFRSPF